MKQFDVIVIGAGAAGLFCAGEAILRGLKVLLIDHANKTAEKIRISGGGRCNFSNRELDLFEPERHFVSQNPRFCRSALKRFTPQDFIELVENHGIAYHEKHRGQLFCDGTSSDIIRMLEARCTGVTRWQPCSVENISFQDARYTVHTSQGAASSPQLVVATGGLSIPQIGATDIGYRIAKQFNIPLVPTQAGLVPLVFNADAWQDFVGLAGMSLPVIISCEVPKNAKKPSTTKKISFHEDLLFTHRGLSGPAALQISSYLRPQQSLRINLMPDFDEQFNPASRKSLTNELALHLPSRLAEVWVTRQADWQRPVNEISAKSLQQLKDSLQNWQLSPSGTEGYKKAEVTVGGVDTQAISSQSMECLQQAGLYFIGEVVDVTGWLGGYNFQWAWASAYACAQNLQASD